MIIEKENASVVLADAHVHFYSCFDRRIFFDNALANFKRASVELGITQRWSGVLFLTEGLQENFFHQLRTSATQGRSEGAWSIHPTGERCSLSVRRFEGEELVLIAGKQIAVSEGLEVLLLGYDGDFPQGRSFSETLEFALASDALAVIPWGFGKWWLRRGKLVDDAIRSEQGDRLFLGDNSGRCGLGLMPKLFKTAASLKIPILPGTDPLPFTGESTKVGAYGFSLECDFDRNRPASSIRQVLRNDRSQPRCYGRGETVFRFFWHQTLLQLRKRKPVKH